MTVHPNQFLQKTDRAQFLIDNLNLPKASGIEDAVWEEFQIDHLNDDSLFRINNKSRQIAFSFLSAAEAVAEAVMDARDSIFTSINQEEAKEKIRYANAVYENLEIGGLPKLIIENQLELEFENGARLVSHPAKPVRGKPKSNWYADEFAHVQHDREIFKGSTAIITKGGRIRIGSSPMGASGVFYEVFTQEDKYPGYSRKSTPWWEVQAFCSNVKLARLLAPKMTTFERVDRFGKDRIKAIYANTPEEDFQQEYECMFVDESTAWITWDEIKFAQSLGENLHCVAAVGKKGELSKLFDAINELKRLIQEGKVEPILALGMDIGRTKHATEIIVLGCSNLGLYPVRLILTMENCEFDDQLNVLMKVMEILPIKKGLIDRTGIGRNLAENASRKYPFKLEGVDFTMQSKQLWATDAKMLIQQRKTPLPNHRDFAYQIHSIKRIVTPSKNVVFDTVRNEKHHADKFWAWGLGLAAACAELYIKAQDESESSEEYSGW